MNKQADTLLRIMREEQATQPSPPTPHSIGLVQWHYVLFSPESGKPPHFFQTTQTGTQAQVLAAANFEAAWHKHTHFALFRGRRQENAGELFAVCPVVNALGQPIATHGGSA